MTTKQAIFDQEKNPNPEEALCSKFSLRTHGEGLRLPPSTLRNVEHSLHDYHDYAEERGNPKKLNASIAIISGVFANTRMRI